MNRIGSTGIAARTVNTEGRHLTNRAVTGWNADSAEAILITSVGEVCSQRVGGGVGGKVPIHGGATSNHVAYCTADHVGGESRGSKAAEEFSDVCGDGGADRRLGVHAPLAAAPSPMKRKSRHAA